MQILKIILHKADIHKGRFEVIQASKVKKQMFFFANNVNYYYIIHGLNVVKFSRAIKLMQIFSLKIE